MENHLIKNEAAPTKRHSDKFQEDAFHVVHEYMETMGASESVKLISMLFNEFVDNGSFIEMANDDPERAKNMVYTVTRTMSFLTELYEKYDLYEQYLALDLRMESEKKKMELKKETN